MSEDKWVRPDLPPMPKRVARLPVSEMGYPVPWFVAWADGKPDFRVIERGKLAKAHNEKLCWVCGQSRGSYLAFVIGPMCAVNRISSEPPSHRECAEFSAKACPFLARPEVKRREGNLPENLTLADRPGVAIARNPGAAAVWLTRSYQSFRVSNGWLFKMGEPTEVLWYARGREATDDEILESIHSGYPLLREPAEREGPRSVAVLEQSLRMALNLVWARTTPRHPIWHAG